MGIGREPDIRVVQAMDSMRRKPPKNMFLYLLGKGRLAFPQGGICSVQISRGDRLKEICSLSHDV